MSTFISLLAGFLAALIMLAGPATARATETKQGPAQVVEGAKKIGEGVEQTAKGIGTTVTEGAKEADKRLKSAGEQGKPVGDKLHDRAKGFGEALWDGLKYAGRTVYGFFTGSK